jgi:pimeloyl-ACP methyl ester carboxylesterase
MTAFTLGTATLSYTDVGTGLPFVFEHRIGGDVRQPSKVFSPPSGVRPLSYDARAHGSTVWSGDPCELSFDRFGDDLIGLVLARPAWLARPMPRRIIVLFDLVASALRKLDFSEHTDDGVARQERLPRDRPCKDLHQLEALDAPTLVVAHRQDPIHPFVYGRRLADAIRGARLVEVTARSVNRRQHAAEMQHNLTTFLRQIIEDRTWSFRRAAA